MLLGTSLHLRQDVSTYVTCGQVGTFYVLQAYLSVVQEKSFARSSLFNLVLSPSSRDSRAMEKDQSCGAVEDNPNPFCSNRAADEWRLNRARPAGLARLARQDGSGGELPPVRGSDESEGEVQLPLRGRTSRRSDACMGSGSAKRTGDFYILLRPGVQEVLEVEVLQQKPNSNHEVRGQRVVCLRRWRREEREPDVRRNKDNPERKIFNEAGKNDQAS